jgi:hypothetical protein
MPAPPLHSASPPPPPPPPPLAGQPPSLTVSSIEATSVLATIAPPRGGCTPVAYVVSHARARTMDAPARTAVPAGGGALTARLGNLAAGVEYEAIVVGTCADGTKTPTSAPVRFTPVAPASTAPICPGYAWVVNSNGAAVSSCIVSATNTLTDCTLTGGFNAAKAIAVVGSTAWVVNSANSTVSVCTVSATTCTLTGCADSGATLLSSPNAIVIEGSMAWVSNVANSVTACAVSDKTLGSCVSSSVLGNPSGIAIDAANSVAWVSTETAGVQACSISGKALTSCDNSGANLGGAYNFGITITGSTAWVATIDSTLSTGTVYACVVSGTKQLSSCADAGGPVSGLKFTYNLVIVGNTAWVADSFKGLFSCTVSGLALTSCSTSLFASPRGIAFSTA